MKPEIGMSVRFNGERTGTIAKITPGNRIMPVMIRFVPDGNKPDNYIDAPISFFRAIK